MQTQSNKCKFLVRLLAVLSIFILVALPSTAYGAPTSLTSDVYNTAWIPINLLVITVSFAIIALIYTLSNVLPRDMRAKLHSLVMTEINQNLISVLILIILFSATVIVGQFSASLPLTGQYACNLESSSCNPFIIADAYVDTLTFVTGINLLNQIYSNSISYAINARIWSGVGQSIPSSIVPSIASLLQLKSISLPFIQITPVFGGDLGISYAIISDLLVGIFTPLLMVTLGTMFIQYIMISVIEFSAFSIVLPIALMMRSFAFTGAGLRTAANSVLAVAIAAYLIYPTMVAFNPSIISWIFTSCQSTTTASGGWCNPTYKYLNTAYTLPDITVSTFLSQSSTQVISGGPSLTTLGIGQLSSVLAAADPFSVTQTLFTISNNVAQFMFTSVMLFALDLTVTLGFGVGLAKALTGGLDGVASFWSNV